MALTYSAVNLNGYGLNKLALPRSEPAHEIVALLYWRSDARTPPKRWARSERTARPFRLNRLSNANRSGASWAQDRPPTSHTRCSSSEADTLAQKFVRTRSWHRL